MQKDKRTSLLRKVASLLLAYLVLPCALLLALEGVARLLAPDDMTFRLAKEALLDRRGGQFPYVNRAGYHGKAWQREVSINSLHLRSPEFDSHADTLARLLLIGDSVIFGLGLADEEAPTALLEAHLANRYRVLNAGVPGYTNEHTVAFLKQFGDRLHPDAVVLGYCLNDPVPGNTQTLVIIRRENKKFNWLARTNYWLISHSMLYLQLKNILNVYRLRHGYMQAYRPLYNEASWERSRTALLELVNWTRARQIPFFLVVFPHRDQLIDEVPTDDHPQRLLAGLSREAGFGLLDLRSVLDPDDYLTNDALHLDKRGMDKAMQAVARFLQDDLSTQLTSTQ